MRIPTHAHISPSELPTDAGRPAPKKVPEKEIDGIARKADPDAVKVHVSAEARKLADAHPTREADEAKIARLRETIESGAYDVDPSKLARDILNKG